MRNYARQLVEPEKRELRQHSPFVWNRRGEHDIESGKAVRRYDEQAVAQVINVADFPAAAKFQRRKIRFQYRCVHLGRCH